MSIADLLGTLDAFKDLTLEELGQLASHVKTRHFAPGEVIVHDGDPATECFVVVSGSAGVSRHTLKPVATLKPHDLFGEIALIDGSTRAASVTALEPTECLAIPAEIIPALLDTNPHFSFAFLRLAVSRLAELEAA